MENNNIHSGNVENLSFGKNVEVSSFTFPQEDKMKSREEYLEYMREYYLKNKDKIRLRKKLYERKCNYAYDKSPKRVADGLIRGKTRKKYPLENKQCEFCSDLATQHHHYTTPMEIDKFNYICHKCHIVQNRIKETKNGK